MSILTPKCQFLTLNRISTLNNFPARTQGKKIVSSNIIYSVPKAWSRQADYDRVKYFKITDNFNNFT